MNEQGANEMEAFSIVMTIFDREIGLSLETSSSQKVAGQKVSSNEVSEYDIMCHNDSSQRVFVIYPIIYVLK